MTIWNSAKMTIKTMFANKMRTFLTMLGIIIGIASVVVVFSAGEGINRLVVGQIEDFGTDTVETEVRVPSNRKGVSSEARSASAIASGVQVTTLTLDDMKEVSKIKNIKNAYGAILSQEQVSYQQEARKTFVYGVSASYVEVDVSKVAEGRFFSEAEDASLAQVVVLGSKIKEKLFGDQDAVGKTITLRHQKFLVLGVMEERGASIMNFDDFVYLPVRTLQKRIMGIDYIFYMMHQLEDVNKAEETAAEITSVMRANHDITDPAKDDFRVTTMAESLEMMQTVVGAITLLLLAIVVVSLIVGGVGIMNVMYVVVSERTSEIGLRKAVGARVSDILWQFLIESTIITTIGGIFGIAFGLGLSFVLSWVVGQFGIEWEFIVPARAYIVSIIFSIICGVLFGLYPARKAAGLSPIEAMRSE